MGINIFKEPYEALYSLGRFAIGEVLSYSAVGPDALLSKRFLTYYIQKPGSECLDSKAQNGNACRRSRRQQCVVQNQDSEAPSDDSSFLNADKSVTAASALKLGAGGKPSTHVLRVCEGLCGPWGPVQALSGTRQTRGTRIAEA